MQPWCESRPMRATGEARRRTASRASRTSISATRAALGIRPYRSRRHRRARRRLAALFEQGTDCRAPANRHGGRAGELCASRALNVAAALNGMKRHNDSAGRSIGRGGFRCFARVLRLALRAWISRGFCAHREHRLLGARGAATAAAQVATADDSPFRARAGAIRRRVASGSGFTSRGVTARSALSASCRRRR